MTDQYDVWAKNWATGMRIAAPMVAPRQIAQRDKAKANRAAGAKRPCGIKGCTRHSFKGQMCRKHYALVPYESKRDLMIACWQASITTAERHHKKMLRELRVSLSPLPPTQ